MFQSSLGLYRDVVCTTDVFHWDAGAGRDAAKQCAVVQRYRETAGADFRPLSLFTGTESPVFLHGILWESDRGYWDLFQSVQLPGHRHLQEDFYLSFLQSVQPRLRAGRYFVFGLIHLVYGQTAKKLVKQIRLCYNYGIIPDDFGRESVTSIKLYEQRGQRYGFTL